MDAMGDPHVRKVVIMTAAQIGKTAMLMNLLGYYMHYYPAPVLVIQLRRRLQSGQAPGKHIRRLRCKLNYLRPFLLTVHPVPPASSCPRRCRPERRAGAADESEARSGRHGKRRAPGNAPQFGRY